MTQNQSVFENVLKWLHQGYPEGVPPKDYFALLALLKRSLSEEEVVKAAQTVLKGAGSDTVTDDEIRVAIQKVTEKEPNPEEIHQVASRLASVGWPLAAHSG
jgi:nucleotide-binding universal stress UspA family protein